MDPRFGGGPTRNSGESQSSPPDDFDRPGVIRHSSSMSVGAVTDGIVPGNEGGDVREEARDGPRPHRTSSHAGMAPFPPPDERWGNAHDVRTPRLDTTPRHLARPWDMPLPPPVNFMAPPGGLVPDSAQRDLFDRHAQAAPDRQASTQLPSPAQLYGSGAPGGYPLPHTAQRTYGGPAYSPSYGHPPYAAPHIPGVSASYDSASTPYASQHRSVDNGPPESSSHFRPTSSSWDYGYQPMASIKPPPLDTFREIDAYHATTSPRTVNPALSSRSSRDPYDPFIRPEDRTPVAGYVMSTSPNDFASSSSNTYPRSNHTPMLPDADVKTRRTSLESGTRRTPHQQIAVTSRLGLDPIAKQERRREQNRLAQRAFRARAKQREQEKASDTGER